MNDNYGTKMQSLRFSIDFELIFIGAEVLVFITKSDKVDDITY